MRLIAKTVNQDDPSVYHLFYGDEEAHAGADLTFFEYPLAKPGRAGAGMIHRIVHRVGSPDVARVLGRPAAGRGHPGRARRERRALRGPRDARPRAGGRHERRPGAHGRAPGGPRGARAARLRGRPGLQRRARPLRRAPGARARRTAVRRRSLRAARRPARRLDRLRSGPRRARTPERGHRPPRGVGDVRRRPADLDRTASTRRGCRTPASSTATTSTRSTSASRAASSTSSPRRSRASSSTASPSRSSAAGSSCRRSSRTGVRRSRRG